VAIADHPFEAASLVKMLQTRQLPSNIAKNPAVRVRQRLTRRTRGRGILDQIALNLPLADYGLNLLCGYHQASTLRSGCSQKNSTTISCPQHRSLLLIFVLVPIGHRVDVIRPMPFVKPNGDGLFLD
jgi:hypothetical protein